MPSAVSASAVALLPRVPDHPARLASDGLLAQGLLTCWGATSTSASPPSPPVTTSPPPIPSTSPPKAAAEELSTSSIHRGLVAIGMLYSKSRGGGNLNTQNNGGQSSAMKILGSGKASFTFRQARCFSRGEGGEGSNVGCDGRVTHIHVHSSIQMRASVPAASLSPSQFCTTSTITSARTSRRACLANIQMTNPPFSLLSSASRQPSPRRGVRPRRSAQASS